MRPCIALVLALVAGHLSGPPAIRAQELDTNAVPASFRPYVHLLASAEVVVPASGPNWRAMDIKDYDQESRKYQELEALVLKLWPQVQILTVILDTLRPTFLGGIGTIPQDTLLAQRREIKEGREEFKAEKKSARKSRRNEEPGDTDTALKEDDEGFELSIGDGTDGPDTLFVPDDDCMIALQEQQGYIATDSIDAQGRRVMIEDTTYSVDMGMKEGFLLVHLLDRQNPGMLDFADDYARAVRLPFWGTVKMFSRLSGYRLNRSYDPEGADGRIEHIIRKHGLDLLDPPCSPE